MKSKNKTLLSQPFIKHTTIMTISKTKYSNANFLIKFIHKGNQWRTLLMEFTSYLWCSRQTEYDQFNIIVCTNTSKTYNILEAEIRFDITKTDLKLKQ